MTNTKYATGFQVGALNVAIEVYGLKAPRVWGVEKTDAVSVACDCGIISVVLSLESELPRRKWCCLGGAVAMVGLVAACFIDTVAAATELTDALLWAADTYLNPHFGPQ